MCRSGSSTRTFIRTINSDPESKQSEFVGRIAEQAIRVKYVGKLIKKQHDHGSSFARADFPDNTDKPTTSMFG